MGYTNPIPKPSSRDIEYPKPPPGRLIREGTIGDCSYCGSTTIKRWIWFGKIIGCINPQCKNYFE